MPLPALATTYGSPSLWVVERDRLTTADAAKASEMLAYGARTEHSGVRWKVTCITQVLPLADGNRVAGGARGVKYHVA